MKKDAYIYFMCSENNSALYVGVTHNLMRRVAEHKAKINEGFTFKYNCNKLVYWEVLSSITEAIQREKQLKNWKREWKDALVVKENFEWADKSHLIGVDEEFVKNVKEYYVDLDCGSGPQ